MLREMIVFAHAISEGSVQVEGEKQIHTQILRNNVMVEEVNWGLILLSIHGRVLLVFESRVIESRVLLKADSGYPKDVGATISWQTLGMPFAGTLLDQLTSLRPRLLQGTRCETSGGAFAP